MRLLIDSKVAHFNAYVVLRVWLAAKCVSITISFSLCMAADARAPVLISQPEAYVEAIKGEPVEPRERVH